MTSSVILNQNLDSSIRAVRMLIELTELRRSAPAPELRQHLSELLNGYNADSWFANRVRDHQPLDRLVLPIAQTSS